MIFSSMNIIVVMLKFNHQIINERKGNKMKKKIISAAIATAMCASMIPAPSMAYADGTEDTEYSMVTSAPFYSEDF